MILRNYQESIYKQVDSANTDDLIQLDTGGGKTPILVKLAIGHVTILIAHRNFLVEQISQTLTLNGASHQIIGNSVVTRRCKLFQRNHNIQYGGQIWVTTIQSLISRYKNGKLPINTNSVQRIIIDEAKHVADGNMWAKVREIFPNARQIGADATPCRLDGQGLHKDCGGLYDRLVQADELRENSTQWLIASGYLSDYEYWCPPTDGFDVSRLRLKKNGRDYTPESLDEAMRMKKAIAGSVVQEYKRLADGKRNLVYCTSIEMAKQVMSMFVVAGHSTTYIASSLSIVENWRRVDAFRSGEVTILINVEMVTEGFDLPEIECVQKVRPTASFALNRQMDGRNLRPKPNGNKAIFIDHVGNVLKHGLPDDYIEWSLTGTPKNKSEPKIDCENCGFVHNPYLANCPNCGIGNWLRDQNAENSPKVLAEWVDIELVKKVRDHFRQFEIREAREKSQQEYELKLMTEVQQHKWKYGSNAVGQLCEKLANWFAENLAQTDIEIKKINDFILGKQPDLKFWSSNFTIHDLKTKNPKKCKRVLDKWLSN